MNVAQRDWTPVGLILCAALSCLGCGHIDAPGDPGEALWTLSCRIEHTEPGLDPGDLRLAFLWGREMGPTNGVAGISQDAPIKPHFPASFTVDLYDLPPDEAMIAGENELAGLDLAVGMLLVYDDRNHNGQLDLLMVDAQDPVDYRLGPAEQYLLVFTMGTPTGQSVGGLAVEPGLNLFLLNGPDGTEKLGCDRVLGISLVDSLLSQHQMCVYPPAYSFAERDLGEVDPAQVPVDAQVTCADRGRALSFEAVGWEQEGVCQEITEVHLTGSASIEQDQPPPDGWPCEVT